MSASRFGEACDLAGEDQPPARHVRAAFSGIAAMGEGGGFIQHGMKEALVGFELESLGLNAVCVREHAVGGHDGETFDAIRAGHVCRSAYTRAHKCKGAALQPPLGAIEFMPLLDLAHHARDRTLADGRQLRFLHPVPRRTAAVT